MPDNNPNPDGIPSTAPNDPVAPQPIGGQDTAPAAPDEDPAPLDYIGDPVDEDQALPEVPEHLAALGVTGEQLRDGVDIGALQREAGDPVRRAAGVPADDATEPPAAEDTPGD